MTVKELIKKLKSYPPDAEVFIYDTYRDDSAEINNIATSEDAPLEEVYIEVRMVSS